MTADLAIPTGNRNQVARVFISALSVVIPVHNEEENIGDLLQEVISALESRIDYEIVVVDDASEDKSADKSLALSDHCNVRVISHDVQQGQSAAILSGIRASKHPWIITMDGDGQNNPKDILALIATADKHHNSAIAVMGQRVQRRDSVIRRWSSLVANKIRASLLKDDTPDTGCGLKLFRRDQFLELPRFDHMHRFLPALFLRAGLTVVSVPVTHRPRLHGRSHYGIRNRLFVGLVDLFGVMWLRRRTFPSQDNRSNK